MDTLTERETEREDVPRRQDGSIDLNELARGLLEDCGLAIPIWTIPGGPNLLF